MAQFADRLIEQILAKDSRCIVGLDPRVDQMPAFVRGNGAYAAITAFHELVIDAVADLVPAVKPQLAFFEQYGVAGIQAFENTVLAAKQRGLLQEARQRLVRGPENFESGLKGFSGPAGRNHRSSPL